MTQGQPSLKTLTASLEAGAASFPDAILFYEADNEGMVCETVSYRDAVRRVDDMARRIVAAGVRHGDRVTVRLPKSADAMLLMFAVSRVGGVYVPINPDFTEHETARIIVDSEPVLLIDDGQCLPIVDALGMPRLSFPGDLRTGQKADLPAPPTPDDIAVMLYTSGTTGKPKGAPLRHRHLLSNVVSLGEAWGLSRGDRILHVLPAFHGHGLFLGIIMPVAFVASITLLPKFSADATIRLLPKSDVFFGVPAIYTRLLSHEEFDRAACETLRLATSGSAPLPPEIFIGLEDRLGFRVVERYGLTETCILTTNPIDGSARVGSVGRPLSCIEIRLMDEEPRTVEQGEVGRVQARGSSIADSYWGGPDVGADSWTEDGWFDTGDLGRFDEDGFLWLVGRKKDLIISGGFNVYPREVELEIEAIEGVEEVAVFGVPHPDFGEGVVAAVVGNDASLDPERLSATLAQRIAKYKQPKRILVMDSLPRNAMGKIVKTNLQDRHSGMFSPACQATRRDGPLRD